MDSRGVSLEGVPSQLEDDDWAVADCNNNATIVTSLSNIIANDIVMLVHACSVSDEMRPP